MHAYMQPFKGFRVFAQTPWQYLLGADGGGRDAGRAAAAALQEAGRHNRIVGQRVAGRLRHLARHLAVLHADGAQRAQAALQGLWESLADMSQYSVGTWEYQVTLASRPSWLQWHALTVLVPMMAVLGSKAGRTARGEPGAFVSSIGS